MGAPGGQNDGVSTLTSSSTLADAEAAWDDNADYAEVGSTTKAQAFIQAGRILLRRLPSRVASGRGAADTTLNVGAIERQLQQAQRWLAANGSQRNLVADLRRYR